jgi:hypothetical protein
MSVVDGVLDPLLTRRVAATASTWLAAARSAASDRANVVEAFALVTRKLGKTTLAPTGEETTALAAGGITWPIGGWGVDELGRVMLLSAASHALNAEAFQALAAECYASGDNRERQAVLKALPLLPAPERFLEIAVDACRTSIQPIFEAIACENPYPARYFPELNFNQMVLKTVFIGVALERIVDLDTRLTPDLARMGAGYASERRAAGRPVPSDLSRITKGALA